MRLVACVPNFSEGRNRSVIDAIVNVIEGVEGVSVLDVEPGEATNRTVITFIGSPEMVEEAAFRAIKRASELIDMRQHRGAHPRIGATDVCPFVPVSEVTMDECVEIARRLGRRVGDELGIPVYLYENAATSQERRNLAEIRKGEYEGLIEKLTDPLWRPDFGPSSFDDFIAKTGATVVGAREFLIAYNVNLNTRDVKIAKDIALEIRESGRYLRDADGKIVRDEEGNKVRKPGLLKDVKAIGWYIEEYGRAQISINLINYRVTPLHVVFETCVQEAEKRGVRVTGSEIVGLVPKDALLEAGRYFLQKQGKSPGLPEREIVEMAIISLGLNEIAPFDPEEKIIEYRMNRDENLVRMSLRSFADEVSATSPAPGGGSVAAYAGALASALTSMVANLTYGRKRYEGVQEDMASLSIEAQSLKEALLLMVDEDTRAFNDVIEARRMPKSTPEEAYARARAIQDGYKKAASVPLRTMELALSVMPLARKIAETGNVNSLTDVAVATLLARAAVLSAGLNVRINLGEIDDQTFVTSMRSRVGELSLRSDEDARRILEIIERRMREDLGA